MKRPNTGIIRLTVATASLIAIITMGIPWADEYVELRRAMSEFSELQTEKDEIHSRSIRLVKIEESLNEKLEELSQQSVRPETAGEVREKLIEIVRHQGGRLRSLDLTPSNSRPWALEGDDPNADTMPEFAQESDHELHQHDVEMSADGTLESIVGILREMIDQGWFIKTRLMNISPTGKPEAPVSIEIRMTFYGLAPRQIDPNDDFAFRDPGAHRKS